MTEHEELIRDIERIKERARPLFRYMPIVHLMGLLCSGILFGLGFYMAGFIAFILATPDVDDLALYMRKIKNRLSAGKESL